MAPHDGQTVLVHYTGTLSDGSTFDSSRDRAPLQFTLGAGEVIPGFDDAVRPLEVGESVTVTIPSAEAYGDYEDEGVQAFPLDAFPSPPEEGWVVELQGPDGRSIAATVVEVGAEEAKLDFNHPLAGQDLTFDIELVSVEPEATEDAAE